MRSFDQIYIIDLHGNRRRGETAPDGSEDKNVFDIEQGVAISLFVKKSGVERGVWRSDVWGKQQAKYEWSAGAAVRQIAWDRVEPVGPHYLFQERNNVEAGTYEQNWSVQSIFPVNSVGIVTARDSLTVHFTREELEATLSRFVALDPESARAHFGLGKDVRDWQVEWAQADVRCNPPPKGEAVRISYRPFDKRHTFYTGNSRGFHCYPRGEVMRHMLRENVALITSRVTKGEVFRHVQAADTVAEVICMSPNTSNNGFLFPLYLYPPEDGKKSNSNFTFEFGKDAFAGKDRIENIAPEFRTWIDARYGHGFTPQQIFGFIYAVLHAPTYRSRYADFLRTDFPRVPFPEGRTEFETLSALGWELAEVHLMRREVPAEEGAATESTAPTPTQRDGSRDRPGDDPAAPLLKGRGFKLGAYFGKGDNRVGKPRWSEVERKVWINEAQGFADIPADVWAFTIGGYRVIDKYLKSRKGRTLSLDEIENVEKVANILAFTILRMERIDAAYALAFGDAGDGNMDGAAVDATGADDIHSDPGIMGGEHVFRGTRVPVRAVAEMLDAGADEAELL